MALTESNAEKLFAAAARLPAGPLRASFLQETVGSNLELLETIERMLKLHDDAGSFLELSALERDPTLVAEWTPEKPPECDFLRLLGVLRGGSGRPEELGSIGHFKVTQVLGVGSFSVVLLAEDQVLGREVAIKLLAPEIAADPAATQRFLQEARSIAALRDERVVQIYEVGEQAGVPFFVMEYLPCGSLQSYLREHGSLTLKDGVTVLLQVAQALRAAHQKGILHRDVKPSNVLIDQFPARVKLSDFGLAHSGSDSGPEPVVGTPQFSSPEQLRGSVVDQRSDLFSLGCLGYALLTGQSPFAGVSRTQTVQLTMQAKPEPLTRFGLQAPAKLEQLLLQLVAKDPEERPASAAEVVGCLSEVANLLAGAQAASDPAGSEPAQATARTWSRRAFALSGLGVLGIGAAGLGARVLFASRSNALPLRVTEPSSFALFDQKLSRYLLSMQNAVLIDHENSLHPQPNYYWRCEKPGLPGAVTYRFPFERPLAGCRIFVQGFVSFGFDAAAWLQISASADNRNWHLLQSLKLERSEYWKNPGQDYSTPLLPESADNTLPSHMPQQDLSVIMRGQSVLYLKAEMFAVELLPDNEGGSLGPAAAQFLRCRPDNPRDPLKIVPLI